MENYTEKDYVKVAVMYYDEGMTQAEIAKKLGVSRSLVSKMLIEAREAKIIEVFINSQSVHTIKLEREMEQRFGLRDVVVIDTIGLTEAESKRKISRVAANYIVSYLKRNSAVKKIGISWGETLRQVVSYIPYGNFPEHHIYPLIGGMGTEHFYLHSNQLVQIIAQKIRAQAHYLYVPAMISSLTLRKELEKDPIISSVIQQGRTVDLGLFGIASLNESSTMVEIGYISSEDSSRFQDEWGAVGDINSQFFDEKGQSIQEINEHVMGVSLEDLKKIPTKLVVSHGENRAAAIRVGIENQMVDILITTDETARLILSE